MPIQYALYENVLTPDPDDFNAQVTLNRSVDLDALIDDAVAAGSTVGRADLLAAMELVIAAAIRRVADGDGVNLGGLVEFSASVTGVFNGRDDRFDPARHQVRPNAKPGVRLRREVQARAVVQKGEPNRNAPAPLEFLDLGSGTRGETLTPNNIGTLNGGRLKFDPAKPDEGIFFLAADGGAETRVEPARVQRNKPSQLVFLLPALPAGDYTLEVRARTGGGSEVRRGTLDAVLSVPGGRR